MDLGEEEPKILQNVVNQLEIGLEIRKDRIGTGLKIWTDNCQAKSPT